MLLFSVIKALKNGACRWISNKWYGEEIVEVGLVGAAAAAAAEKLGDLSYFKGFLVNQLWKWVSSERGFNAIWEKIRTITCHCCDWGMGVVTGGAGLLAAAPIGQALTIGFGMAKEAISDTVTMYAEMKIVTNVGREALDILTNGKDVSIRE